MIHSDALIAEEPFFFDLPEGAALAREKQEIAVARTGVPCGIGQKQIELGYVLTDGTVLLESERDSFGRYKGGAGMDGMYLQTGRLYAPVPSWGGEIMAFQEVKPENYLAAAEMRVESNYNQIDGIINNEAPKPAVPDYEDEALYLVGGTAYLHIQTSEDDRSYTRDDCYTTYSYALYDKETLRQLDSGRMEIVEDVRDDPRQNLRPAAENILECRTLLGGASVEPVSMDILEALQNAAVRETQAADSIVNSSPPKSSVLDSLRQCRDRAEKSRSANAPEKPRRAPER